MIFGYTFYFLRTSLFAYTIRIFSIGLDWNDALILVLIKISAITFEDPSLPIEMVLYKTGTTRFGEIRNIYIR